MKTVYTGCNLIDVEDGCRIIPDASVFVDGDKIVKAVSGKADTAGFTEVNLQGKYVAPGLVNLHAHLFGTGRPSKVLGGGKLQKVLIKLINTRAGDKILDKLVLSAALQQLRSGVTTVRCVGDFKYSDVRLRDKINEGRCFGPRLLVSGPAITVKGGHGDGTFAMTSDSTDELVSFVDKNKSAGVDFIKICITGGVMDAKKKGEPGELKMNVVQAKAVCDRAHELGLIVASHTESTKGMEVAAEAGVDTIEHGSFPDDGLIGKIKAYGGKIVATFSPALPLARLSPELTKLNEMCVYNSEVVLDGMTEGAIAAEKNGIPVGLGTDSSCPFSTQYNMWREVCYYSRMTGASTAKALYTATLGNAAIAGVADVTGSIKEGKSADMIVLDGNPLDDLAALKEPCKVICRGVEVKGKVKRNAFIEAKLDELYKTLQVKHEIRNR